MISFVEFIPDCVCVDFPRASPAFLANDANCVVGIKQAEGETFSSLFSSRVQQTAAPRLLQTMSSYSPSSSYETILSTCLSTLPTRVASLNPIVAFSMSTSTVPNKCGAVHTELAVLARCNRLVSPELNHHADVGAQLSSIHISVDNGCTGTVTLLFHLPVASPCRHRPFALTVPACLSTETPNVLSLHARTRLFISDLMHWLM